MFHRNEFLCVAVSRELAAAASATKTCKPHGTGAATITRTNDNPPSDDEPPAKTRLKLYAAD